MEEIAEKDRDQTLWILLNLARDTIIKVRNVELAPYNITPQQAYVLKTIYDFGHKATFKKISKQIFRELNSVSEQITRMEKKGLLKKIKNAEEATLTRFELTQKGLEATRFAGEDNSLHKIMSVLSGKERQQLKSCLEKLLAKAQELC